MIDTTENNEEIDSIEPVDPGLKAALLRNESIPDSDLETFAASLSENAIYLADMGEDGLEEADELLSLLYLCQERLPDSNAIHTALLGAALALVGGAGDNERFDMAEKRLALLLDFQTREQDDDLLLGVSAKALLLIIGSYLDCEPPEEEKARGHYATLEKLAGQHEDMPVMHAMLAWGKRLFVRGYLFEQNVTAAEAALEDLRAYLDKHADNALVARHYSGACSHIFHYCLKQSGLYHRAVELLAEMERLTRKYCASYRELGKSDDFNDYFFGALSAMASKSAEDKTEKPLLDCLDRLLSIKKIFPESFNERKPLLAQIYQNLAYIYGIGNARKTESYIKLLRELRKESPEIPELAGTLTDALYNYATEYAEDDTVKHAAKIHSLIDELERIAAEIDNTQTRTRYASALFNLYINSPANNPDLKTQEKLYRYSLENTIDPAAAEQIAAAEVKLIASAGEQSKWELMQQHHKRAKALCGAEQYRDNEEMAAQSAAADFNVLTMAADMKNIALEQSMMDNLTALAMENPGSRGVVLRLVKAAKNIMYDYGEIRDVARAEAVLNTILPLAAPFYGEPEIANRVVDASFNLCVDMKNSGNMKRTGAIYEQVKDLVANGESAMRLEKLKTEYGKS